MSCISEGDPFDCARFCLWTFLRCTNGRKAMRAMSGTKAYLSSASSSLISFSAIGKNLSSPSRPPVTYARAAASMQSEQSLHWSPALTHNSALSKHGAASRGRRNFEANISPAWLGRFPARKHFAARSQQPIMVTPIRVIMPPGGSPLASFSASSVKRSPARACFMSLPSALATARSPVADAKIANNGPLGSPALPARRQQRSASMY
mmetsp:Transcript_86668/g.279958  ORF Transcript_86668/g.279958 Transcript_86668/m.279958 type:complete len:207 (-) Transcript_86668:1883-2503(-)